MRAFSRRRSPLVDAVAIGVLAAVYFAAGRFGLSFASVHESASVIWPPTGIALAALLLFGMRLWPGVLIGAFVVNAMQPAGLLAASGIAVGNTLEAVAAAWLVTRFAGGRSAFHRGGTAVCFVVIAVPLATVISATIGASWLVVVGAAESALFATIWLTWWLGDIVGAIVVGPLLIAWLGEPLERPSRRIALEGGALLVLVLLINMVFFGGWAPEALAIYIRPFLAIPFILLLAYRLELRGATSGIAIFAILAVYGTLRGYGSFRDLPFEHSLMLMQMFIGTVAATTLVLAAMVRQQRDAEAALNASRVDEGRRAAELEALMRVVPAVVWIARDRECRRIDGNVLAQELLRLPMDVNASKTAPPGERPSHFRVMRNGEEVPNEDLPVQRAARLGIPVLADSLDIVFDDGTVKHEFGNAVPLFDDSGNVRGAVAAFLDVTDIRRAEAGRAHLAAIVESSKDAIVSKSLDGTILSWNAGAEQLFGYSAAEMIGQSITRIIPPDCHDEERLALSRLRAGQRIDSYETMRLRGDGSLIDVSLTVSPIFDASGRIIGASKVARDISAMKSAERSLMRQSMRMQALYRLSDAVSRATGVEEMCELALDGLTDAMEADRASVLLFEEDGVMRFKAWRGLSEGYRAAVEGHSPWKQDDADALPITVDDVRADESLAPFREIIESEGIRALAFIPLVDDGRVLGKFMVYYDRPHRFLDEETAICRAIAGSIAYAINRTRTDQALRESETRLRLATQAGRLGVWDWDVVEDRVVWSDSLYPVHGLKPGEFGGTADAFARLVHPDDLDRVREAIDLALREDAPYELEFRAVRPDGGIACIYTSAAVIRDAAGKPLRMLGATMDITSQKEAAQALRESEERYRRLISVLPVGVYTCEAPSGIITFHNEHACTLWGRTPAPGDNDERFCGSFRLFRPDGEPLPHAETPMAEAMREGRSFRNQEVVIERPDGSRITVLVNIDPIRDDAGRIVGAINVFHDTTAIKQAQEALARGREQLEELVLRRTGELEQSHVALRNAERMAAIGTLSAGLGHDMGNLLLPVRVRIEALERDFASTLPTEAREHLKAIGDCMSYLQNLTRGLRLFAIDPHRTNERETCELEEWSAQVSPFYRHCLPQYVEMNWRLARDLPPVRIARHQLTQAVFNLVQNAAEAMKDKREGHLTIAAEPSPEGDRVLLHISDDGDGMTEDVRRRCFEPFFTTKTRGLSTGLGLALVHGIIHKAGGTIAIESRPGQGTTFTVSLALAKKSGNQPESRGESAVVRVSNPRVRSYVNAMLASMGYAVDAELQPERDTQRLWITEHDPEWERRAREFLDGDGDRRWIVLIAPGSENGSESETVEAAEGAHRGEPARDCDRRVLRLYGPPSPLQLRQVLERIAEEASDAELADRRL